MQNIINGGIYEVDLHGLHDSEFFGNHPCLIIQNLVEREIYYIIPLTTYTSERWENLRKFYCCRIKSTNSIARMDKMQVRHDSCIPHRWFSKYKILYPNPDELNSVYKKMLEYFTLSMEKSQNGYRKYYEHYNNFIKICDRFFNQFQFDNFSIFHMNFTKSDLIATCDINLAKFITFDDIQGVFRNYFDYHNLVVRYNEITNKIIITVKING